MADVPPPRSTQTSSAAGSDLMTLLSTWGNNLTTQTHKTFSNLRAQDYIRLVAIIGAYALLRPYLMKLGAHMQMRQHQKDSEASREQDQDGRGSATATATAAATAGDLRGGRRRNDPQQKKIAIPGVDSDSEEEDKNDWGRTARLRQRQMIRDLLVKQEERLQAERDADSDKDIEEFLVD